MSQLFIYTKYLFINKTGLELELKSFNNEILTKKQNEIEIELFENQRKNILNKYVNPYESHDLPTFCDRINRPKNKNNIVLINNNKWKWKDNWKCSQWQYAKDFRYIYVDIY